MRFQLFDMDNMKISQFFHQTHVNDYSACIPSLQIIATVLLPLVMASWQLKKTTVCNSQTNTAKNEK